ncbi:MAG: hypothetical protein K9G26_02425 [Emcibacter sp.]|nr:hypothetical protein [Emcibacter sp.]
MTKLQKLNNLLFAVLAIVIIFSLSPEIYRMVSEWFKKEEVYRPLPNKEVIDLVKDNKFIQTISYNSGYWAWSENITIKDGSNKTKNSPYYIIPVAQTTLENEQNLPQTRGGFAVSEMKLRRNYGQNFNNILIYDVPKNHLKKLFDHRLVINNNFVQKYKDEYFLILQTENLSGQKSNDEEYYLYAFEKDVLTKLNVPKLSNVTFILEDDLPNPMILGRMDFDQNGEFDQHDPFHLFNWNIKDNIFTAFPDEAMTESLQKILDGRSLKKSEKAE